MDPQVQELFATAQKFGLSRVILAIRNTYPTPLHSAFDTSIGEIKAAWSESVIDSLKSQLCHGDDPEALGIFEAVSVVADQITDRFFEAHPEIERNKVAQDMLVVTAAIAAHTSTAVTTAVDEFIAARG